MKLAVLFQFHKDVEVCVNRLEILRFFNPDAAIYGLYGGENAQAEDFRRALDGYLDDFFAFPDGHSGEWKWLNVDQMITEWHRVRGRRLPWDTVFVVAWDMVVVGKLEALFSDLKPGEILLSGLRPVREIERWWYHVNRLNVPARAAYLAFLERMRNEHDFTGEPLACLLVIACYPRAFLDRYSTRADPEPGYMEYKVPICAQAFGTPFCTSHPFRIWWDRPIFGWYSRGRLNRLPPYWLVPPDQRALNAIAREIPAQEIRRQLRKPGGARIFHPVYATYAPEELIPAGP